MDYGIRHGLASLVGDRLFEPLLQRGKEIKVLKAFFEMSPECIRIPDSLSHVPVLLSTLRNNAQ